MNVHTNLDLTMESYAGSSVCIKNAIFSKKIQKQEILPCKKLLFSLSVQNEEIPYKNSGFWNFFVRNSLFLEFLHQTNLRVSKEMLSNSP